jgi:hypothetical protein
MDRKKSSADRLAWWRSRRAPAAWFAFGRLPNAREDGERSASTHQSRYETRASFFVSQKTIWCETWPMKKVLAVLVMALVVAGAVWVAMRVHRAHQQATVAELLPKTTLFLAQVPDFGRTREQWRASDVYQIWREPPVQAWLQKPLAKLPKSQRGRQVAEDFLKLGPTHGFVALTSIENNDPKLIGGFHFEQSEESVRQFIEQRLMKWLSNSSGAKRETIPYTEHKIETVSVSRVVIASAYDNSWFFASNDLASLKGLLDRVDHRMDKSSESLKENEAFRAALEHLPADYAGMVFIEPQPFVEKLMPLIAMTGQAFSIEQLQRLKQVKSVAGAFGFDHGKMREALFVAMPHQGPALKLTRPSLASASTNTFLYSASLMHWPEAWLAPSASRADLPPIVQELANALSERGISAADLQKAFADELELIGEWPPDTRWPVLLVTVPVKDSARARKIADALTSVEVAGAAWTRNEKAGVAYYKVQPFGGFVPLSPAIAVSEKTIVAGSDAAAVEATIAKTADPANALEKSATFREGAARLPAPDGAFAYVDTRLLFERADAALRPLLFMSATFYPALGRNVDISKLPPTEAIAKHLSPIVMSQRYVTDGYLTESVGPITFNEATIGLAGVVGGLFVYFQEGLKGRGLFQVDPVSAPTQTVAPSPSPTASTF